MELDALSGRIALLVDDEEFFLASIVEALHLGAPELEVVTARDGVDALAILDRRPVDVVVTDVQMPRLDGFGLIAQIIARELDVSVVVMTAYGRPTLRERDRIALALECLEKPIDVDHLLETLNEIIRMRATRRLRAVSLPGLLRTLDVERGRATIRVAHEREVAWLHVADGRLIHAGSRAQAGIAVARDALAWTHPEVEIHALPREVATTLDTPLFELVSPEFVPQTHNHPHTQNHQFERARALAEQHTMNTTQSLEKINEIQGTLGAALVDYESGMTLGTIGSGIDLEVASAGNMEVMRAKQRVMRELGISGGIEDILITLQDQYHIIRPVGAALFLYLAIHRKDGNLAMARRQLAKVATELRVD